MFQVFFDLKFKERSSNKEAEYRQVLQNPKIEWCKMVDGTGQNPAFEFMLSYARNMTGALLTICKSEGPIKVANSTIANSFTNWPSGDYRVSFRFFDDVDLNIYNLTYHSSIYR